MQDGDRDAAFLRQFMGDISKETVKRLPISRIRAICRTLPDVTLLSAKAPILLGKLAELFIADVTNRARMKVDEIQKSIITYDDVMRALASQPEYDFLNILLAIRHSTLGAPSSGEQGGMHFSVGGGEMGFQQ